MANITLKPKDGSKSVSLKSGATNATISLNVALAPGETSYDLTACSIKLPVICFKKDAEGEVKAKWNGTAINSSYKIDPNNNQLYDFTLTIPSGSSLSPSETINIELDNIEVTTSAGAGGNISLELDYNFRHGRSKAFTCNTLKISVLNESGSDAASITLSTIAVNENAPYNQQNFLYPSLLRAGELILPIVNTLQFTFSWNGTSVAPAKSKGASFLISFDYGDSLDLAPNQLCSNNASLKSTDPGLTVYDWPKPTPSSSYTSGTQKGNTINWVLSLNSKKGATPIGTWILRPNEEVDWQSNFNISLNFTNIASTNSSSSPLPSNVYIQSIGVSQVADCISVGSFHIKASSPQIFTFEESDSNENFEYHFTGASFGLLSWSNQNGEKELKNVASPSQADGDFLINRLICLPTNGYYPKSTVYKIQDISTWALIYKGSTDKVLSTLENPGLTLMAIDASQDTITESTKQPNSTDFPNSNPDFEIVSGSVKNLGSQNIGGKTYTLLSWHVTGLASTGFCTLSDQSTTQLKGSLKAGSAPYYHLYPNKVGSGLTLTAYQTGGAGGKTATATIPTNNSKPSFPYLPIDMCSLNGTIYVVYSQKDAIILQYSSDGIHWLGGEAIPGLPGGVPSITTDGTQLFLTVFNSNGANVWYSKKGSNWQMYWTSIVVNSAQPTDIHMRYLNQDGAPGLVATFFNVKPYANLATPNDAPIQLLNNVAGGMSFVFFNGYYYLAYQNTNGSLSLVRNQTFFDTNYSNSGISLPNDIYISGITQLAVLNEKLVIICSQAGTNQLFYCYSSDGSSWSEIQPLSLTAKSFSASNFYNLLCISYVIDPKSVKTSQQKAFAIYILDGTDLEV